MLFDATFCDIIRQESNGKHLLIGVYPGDVLVATQIPGVIYVSAWVKVRDLPVGEYQFEMTFLSPQGRAQSPLPYFGMVSVTNAGMPTVMYSGPAPVPVSEAGFMHLQIKLTNTSNQVVCDMIAGKLYIGKQS